MLGLVITPLLTAIGVVVDLHKAFASNSHFTKICPILLSHIKG